MKEFLHSSQGAIILPGDVSDLRRSIDHGRRSLVISALSVAAAPSILVGLGGSALTAHASQTNMRPGRGPDIPKWPAPNDTRQIWIKRQETGEAVVARYFEGGQLNYSEYVKVCNVMRDVKKGTVAHIDVELMDLIFAMQNWLVSWGVDVPMQINSGFRTASTNSALEGAAKNSMHTKGRAADVRIPGVPAEYLGRLASIFSVGGVGFYTDRHFNHIDTGSVRYWRGV